MARTFIEIPFGRSAWTLCCALLATLGSMSNDAQAQPGSEASYQRVDGIVAIVGDEIVLASDIQDRVTQARLEGRTVTLLQRAWAEGDLRRENL